ASRRRHTRSKRDWSSDVCSSDLTFNPGLCRGLARQESLIHFKRRTSTGEELGFLSATWCGRRVWRVPGGRRRHHALSAAWEPGLWDAFTGISGERVGNVVINATRLSRHARTFSSLRLPISLRVLPQPLRRGLHPAMPSWLPMPLTGLAVPRSRYLGFPGAGCLEQQSVESRLLFVRTKT